MEESKVVWGEVSFKLSGERKNRWDKKTTSHDELILLLCIPSDVSMLYDTVKRPPQQVVLH